MRGQSTGAMLLRCLGCNSLFAIDLALAGDEGLQAVEIEIDDRRRIEREQLAQCETAHHSVAQWLTQFRTGTVAKHQRDAGEHSGGGRHYDRAESQKASLPDGLDRGQTTVALGCNGEV